MDKSYEQDANKINRRTRLSNHRKLIIHMIEMRNITTIKKHIELLLSHKSNKEIVYPFIGNFNQKLEHDCYYFEYKIDILQKTT